MSGLDRWLIGCWTECHTLFGGRHWLGDFASEVQRFRNGEHIATPGHAPAHIVTTSLLAITKPGGNTNSLHSVGERLANLCSPRLPILARAASAAPACANDPASCSAVAVKLLISSNTSGAFGCVCRSAHRFLVSTEQQAIRQTGCMSAPIRSTTADPDRTRSSCSILRFSSRRELRCRNMLHRRIYLESPDSAFESSLHAVSRYHGCI